MGNVFVEKLHVMPTKTLALEQMTILEMLVVFEKVFVDFVKSTSGVNVLAHLIQKTLPLPSRLPLVVGTSALTRAGTLAIFLDVALQSIGRRRH